MENTNIQEILKMKNDIIFKAFFSRKGNEKFLKSFLVAMLGKELNIKKIIHDSRLEQLSKESKYGVLDLDVELENGDIINVEMQLTNNYNIEERTTFYAAKKITENLVPTEDYKSLRKVIVIAILNYKLTKLPEYFTKTIRVAEKHRDYELNNEVEYYYVELEKFREQNPDMKEPLNQWLAFLDMERRDLLEMAKKESKTIQEASKYYDELTGDEEIKRLAEIRLFENWSKNASLHTAEERGKQERDKKTEKKLSKWKSQKNY
jgi:predicted transposase/invertase (TIGR01784 family)